MHELIECEFKAVGRARVTAEGPDLEIPASAAVYISIGLHKLLTNAIKHGALSVPAGEVSVKWSFTPGQSGTRLELRWTESGGPPVAKPAHRGFGTLLLERILGEQMNGQIEIEYAAEGLRALINLLIPKRNSDNLGWKSGDLPNQSTTPSML